MKWAAWFNMGRHGEYKVVFRRVFCLNLLTEWMFVSLKKMEDNRDLMVARKVSFLLNILSLWYRGSLAGCVRKI